MKAIIVDDEPAMIRYFLQTSSGIEDLLITGQYNDPEEALRSFNMTDADIAFLDINMPVMNGIELAQKLRMKRSDILIVFVTASEKHIRDFNEIGGDYYILKPYSRETLESAVNKLIRSVPERRKPVFIQMFGNFNVIKKGCPVSLSGKAKEILALVVSRKGNLISNKEIYHTIWENRSYSNQNMTVYFNALRRLKNSLKKEALENIILTNHNGIMANTELFDCDYYMWRENGKYSRFEGEFLSEYSWSESILADLIWSEMKEIR